MKAERSIYRPTSLAEQTAELVDRAREAVANARATLEQQVPDTFLGRKHYEQLPLPKMTEMAGCQPVKEPAHLD